VSVSRLAALAFVTAIAMVSLTDITDGWSWLVGSLVAASLVVFFVGDQSFDAWRATLGSSPGCFSSD
jgi:hypothetical protein